MRTVEIVTQEANRLAPNAPDVNPEAGNARHVHAISSLRPDSTRAHMGGEYDSRAFDDANPLTALYC